MPPPPDNDNGEIGGCALASSSVETRTAGVNILFALIPVIVIGLRMMVRKKGNYV